MQRGIDWVIGMQSSDGGWGAFDADNTRRLIEKLPFSDFGAVIDPPSADVTAHAVEMLAHTGHRDDRVTQRGVQWLLDDQEADGSWFGRWGTNYVYGTGAVVPALIAVGMAPDDERDPARRRGGWRITRTTTAGGARTCAPTPTTTWRGRGASTASQTAWALLALIAVDPASESAARGVRWLINQQRADGGWDEDLYTGTGFPGDFYINYEMYRLVFPISALGRYLRRHEEVSVMGNGLLSSSPRCAASSPRCAGQVPGARLARCGMGTSRVTTWLPELVQADPGVIVVAGVAGALDPSLRPGDVIVANEVRDAHGRAVLRGRRPAGGRSAPDGPARAGRSDRQHRPPREQRPRARPACRDRRAGRGHGVGGDRPRRARSS